MLASQWTFRTSRVPALVTSALIKWPTGPSPLTPLADFESKMAAPLGVLGGAPPPLHPGDAPPLPAALLRGGTLAVMSERGEWMVGISRLGACASRLWDSGVQGGMHSDRSAPASTHADKQHVHTPSNNPTGGVARVGGRLRARGAGGSPLQPGRVGPRGLAAGKPHAAGAAVLLMRARGGGAFRARRALAAGC